ncbi:hypothetical protein H7F30_13005 [Dermacoccus sp. PAMC28757]|uniref:hypothetical protein n=1 Tax=Dermacoccus sp. PAMC28757 TaxID=2762331 RepID=UPI00164DE0BC|nr:hypothetical protein [Dermacoccus sp. PAMC28757]QNK52491.1 hypothetical protein H7F30_13005 [Dermacoccus sp. PAMC28757]
MTEAGSLWLEALRRVGGMGSGRHRKAMTEHLAAICDERGGVPCMTTTALASGAGLTYRGGVDALRDLRRDGWVLTVENHSRAGSVRQLEVPPHAMQALDRWRSQ